MSRKKHSLHRKQAKAKRRQQRKRKGARQVDRSQMITYVVKAEGRSVEHGMNELPLSVVCVRCPTNGDKNALSIPPPPGHVCGQGMGWQSLRTVLEMGGWSLKKSQMGALVPTCHDCQPYSDDDGDGETALGLLCMSCARRMVMLAAPELPICGPFGWASLQPVMEAGGYKLTAATFRSTGVRQLGPCCPQCASRAIPASGPVAEG